jgi:hypothetical protein
VQHDGQETTPDNEVGDFKEGAEECALDSHAP